MGSDLLAAKLAAKAFGRAFVITELRRDASGGLSETSNKFTWTSAGHSAPRSSIPFGLRLRTKRTDYPGAEEPSEQVLGPSFSEFSVQGVWDDRYNSPGFAEETRKAMESLVARGNPVRIEFEELVFVGLITNLQPDYRRKWQQGYTLTISPHYRVRGALRAEVKAPNVGPSPIRAAADVHALLDEAKRTQAEDMPAPYLTTTIAPDVGDALQSLADASDELDGVIDNRFLAARDTAAVFPRLAQAFASIRGKASDVLVQTRTLKSDTAIAYSDAIQELNFEVWARGLALQARLTALTAHEAGKAMSKRTEPRAKAFYRPSAGESLYDISRRFYGTPHRWRDIATRNGLVSLTLQGTELLVIPDAA